jgi:hypothetical protein
VPTVSLLKFKLKSKEEPASAQNTEASFLIYGEPVVNTDRIQNAKQALQNKIGAIPEMVCLQDARRAKMTFTQYLPNINGTSGDPVIQKNASIDLVAGLRNELKLNFQQFRALWAAIFSADEQNQLFRGWVDIELSGGKYTDRVEFDGRLAVTESIFFDDILDTADDSSYSANFDFKTFKVVFSGDPRVLEIELSFTGSSNSPAILNKDKLESNASVAQSIRDIVIGKQIPDKFQYRMRVVKEDGTITCCERSASSDSPNLWITAPQVEACVDEC